MTRILPIIFVVFALPGAIWGCRATSGAQEPILYTAQIIIKFTPEISDPSDQAFVESLSQNIGISLTYVRPMSGGAHVFRVKEPCDEEQLSLALQRLNQKNDVVYAEKDRIMRHQQSSQ